MTLGNNNFLKISGLKLSFGSVQAVNGVDLTVNQGDLTAVIGPNGAGKTTLFNLITGYHRAQEGSILFDDHEISRYTSHKIAQLGTGLK